MKYILLLIVVYTIILLCIYYIFTEKKECFSTTNTSTSNQNAIPKHIKYTYKGYTSLLKDYENCTYTSGGIPKIIFKTSWQKRNRFPKEITVVLNNTIIMNPDYNLYYFDDDEVNIFMKSYSARAHAAYNKIVPGAFKADLFRYCILEKYGGCYSDIGHILQRPFDTICGNNKLVLVKDLFDTGIHNALICCTPHHPFIIKLVEQCIKNIESSYYGYCALSITGPVLAGNMFHKFYYNTLDALSLTDNESENILKKENDKLMFNKYIIPGDSNGIRMLKLEIIGEEKERNDNKYIIDVNNNIFIETKFKNYYNIMYSKQPYYDDYWTSKTVYTIL